MRVWIVIEKDGTPYDQFVGVAASVEGARQIVTSKEREATKLAPGEAIEMLRFPDDMGSDAYQPASAEVWRGPLHSEYWLVPTEVGEPPIIKLFPDPPHGVDWDALDDLGKEAKFDGQMMILEPWEGYVSDDGGETYRRIPEVKMGVADES